MTATVTLKLGERWLQYQHWIDDYVTRQGGVLLGRCVTACEEMRQAFPELTKVPGHVYCAWGKRGHWWLKTETGEIVDPTRGQFPGPIEYEPWKPGDTIRVGSCMECGTAIWMPMDEHAVVADNPHSPFCSEECGRVYTI